MEGSAQVDRCASILYLNYADETLITVVRTWKAGEACRQLSVTHPIGLAHFCSCLARASQMALFNCKRIEKYNLPSSQQERSGHGWTAVVSTLWPHNFFLSPEDSIFVSAEKQHSQGHARQQSCSTTKQIICVLDGIPQRALWLNSFPRSPKSPVFPLLEVVK